MVIIPSGQRSYRDTRRRKGKVYKKEKTKGEQPSLMQLKDDAAVVRVKNGV